MSPEQTAALAAAASAAQALQAQGWVKELALVDGRRQQIAPAPAGVPAAGRTGLAFSGGGIRSATFSLGVLQAVAQAPASLPLFASGAGGEAAAAPVPAPAPAPTSAPPPAFPPPLMAGAAPAPASGSAFCASLLSRFDYLSTVSGGGYVGAFFTALFMPDRLRGNGGDKWRAADDVVGVLASGAPGRIHANDHFLGERRVLAPMAWLRENGRYLLPTGTGDAVYVVAMQVRNWLALHYVMGVVLLVLFSALLLARALVVAQWPALEAFTVQWPLLHGWVQDLGLDMPGLMLGTDVGAAPPAASPTVAATHCPNPCPGLCTCAVVPTAATPPATLAASLWLSPYLLAAGAVFGLLCVPGGVAFWMSYQDDDGRGHGPNVAVLGALVLVGLLAGAFWLDDTDAPRRWVWCAMAALTLAGVLWYLVFAAWYRWRAGRHAAAQAAQRQALERDPLAPDALAQQPYALVSKLRVELTQHVANSLRVALGVLLLGVVDTAGQTLYLLSVQHPLQSIASPAALVGALVWLAKAGAAMVGGQKKDSLLARVPLPLLGGLAGMLIMGLVAALWCFAVNWLVWQGDLPGADGVDLGDKEPLLWALFAGAALFAFVAGQFPSFINLSSLQPFYSARITRTYLGASNGARFEGKAHQRSAAEPVDGDNLRLSDFYAVDSTTTPPTLSLTTLAPLHIVNVTINKTVDPAEQLVQRDRKGQPLAVLPYKFAIDGRFCDFPAADAQATEIARPLSLGQWVGTSGAAFSTGIGRETSLGMSLLMGAANVRLGVWWQSGQGETKLPRSPLRYVTRGVGAVFRTQAYLSYEFRARFYGTHRQWQYLSDGGHFENTALYELLRPERGVRLVLATDCGADEDYRFDDLANLMRLVRIDMGVEVVVQRGFADNATLRGVFGAPEDFAKGKPNQPCALLLRASYQGNTTTWVVLVKPALGANLPADIGQYARLHDSFPQEATTDQFFDEAQWESYRSLGYHTGQRVLNAEVMGALARYIDNLGRPTI